MNADTSSGPTPSNPGWIGGLTTKIAAITALLVAVGGLLDIAISLVEESEPLMCTLVSSLPWCDVQAHEQSPPPPPPPPPPFSPPISFSVTVMVSTNPSAPAQPSSRDWKFVPPNKWLELYIDGSGKQYVYDVVNRLTLGGCSGTEVREEGVPTQWIFITDKGCVGSPMYYSSDGQNWGNLGVMTNVQ
jgi:hypothetical protein